MGGRNPRRLPPGEGALLLQTMGRREKRLNRPRVSWTNLRRDASARRLANNMLSGRKGECSAAPIAPIPISSQLKTRKAEAVKSNGVNRGVGPNFLHRNAERLCHSPVSAATTAAVARVHLHCAKNRS